MDPHDNETFAAKVDFCHRLLFSSPFYNGLNHYMKSVLEGTCTEMSLVPKTSKRKNLVMYPPMDVIATF